MSLAGERVTIDASSHFCVLSFLARNITTKNSFLLSFFLFFLPHDPFSFPLLHTTNLLFFSPPRSLPLGDGGGGEKGEREREEAKEDIHLSPSSSLLLHSRRDIFA